MKALESATETIAKLMSLWRMVNVIHLGRKSPVGGGAIGFHGEAFLGELLFWKNGPIKKRAPVIFLRLPGIGRCVAR